MASNIYRFTPPTCTLLITAKASPLSRWSTQKIAKKLRFQLKFDDPGAPKANPITIRGSQQDLWQLQSSINQYIQKYLSSTPHLETSLSNFALALDNNEELSDQQPWIKSAGPLHHKLFFGSLSHDSAVDYIRLSTVQLFDLVSALEEYQTEIAMLPSKSQGKLAGVVPLWGAVAASLIAAVGVASLLLRSPLSGNIASQPQATPKLAEPIPESAEIIPPPEPRPNARSSEVKSDPLASINKLPPPPAVNAPKPKPDIPDPADYELSEVARQSGFKISSDDPKPKSLARKEAALATPESTERESSASKSELQIPVQPEESDLAQTKRLTELAKENLAANPRSNQLGLIRNYFQNKWQPPAGLKQSLEYRLVLQKNGSIKKIIPLGKASRLYLNQTKIPLNGESFAPPLAPEDSSKIRLLFNPDGNVQVFAE